MAKNVVTIGTGTLPYKLTRSGVAITPEVAAAAAAGPPIEEILAEMDAEEAAEIAALETEIATAKAVGDWAEVSRLGTEIRSLKGGD